jgi:hypothetical protein
MYRHKSVALALVIGSLVAVAACGDDTAAPASTATAPTTALTTAAESTAPTTPVPTTAAPATTTVDTAAPASTDPATSAPTSSAPPPRFTYPDGIRDVRYCEVVLLKADTDGLYAEVWNTMGRSECPQDEWEAIDPAAIAAEYGAVTALANGPRYWTLDRIDATIQLTAPVTTFGTLEMFLGATVDLGAGLPSTAPYTQRPVARDTVFYFDAGSEVYELTDPDGTVYVMQSYSQKFDPTLSADQLAGLGTRLKLPAGWTFSTRVLDADLEVRDVDGIAVVVQDDLENTYQREA